VGKLHTTLNEAVFSLQGGVQLRSPDPAVVAPIDLKQKSLERAALDDVIVAHLDGVVLEWCGQIEQILIEDSELTRKEPEDIGPKSELEYWRHRSQKFSTIIDQLKTRECRVTLGVLREAKASSPEVHKTLKSWKAMDNATTDAANEAKDNVKYLNTLDKYAQPLYDAPPSAVVESLPALLNNIKMMQQIARYYNTTDRMTTLFVKITNQMITNCKQHIKGPGKLWEQDPQVLIANMEQSLKLYEAYQEQYRIAKDKLLLAQPQDGKQFDFSEIAIFGKYELFCKRLQKLIDMFTTIAQFSSLAKHQVEGMGELLARFLDILEEFKRKPYDLLNFSMNQFDRDYLEFNVAIHDLETSLQGFINTSFETIPSTEQALALLKQFQTILQRDNLRADLDNKYMVIFHNYGLDLDAVQRTYEKYKGAPPMVRNAPPVAGNITWCRQLLRRIEQPMKKFQTNKSIMQTKESKKIIRTYNKVASALIEFETLWHKAWTKSIEANKAGLAATLIIRHPTNNRLYVNFDHEILQLIRESKCLLRLQAQVPEVAKMILMQDDKFKQYYNHLTFTLREYDRVVGRVNPVIRGLLEQHLDDLENKIEPALDDHVDFHEH
jgi:dynein heavy chain